CQEIEIPTDLWRLPKLKTLTLDFCSSSPHASLLLQLPFPQSSIDPPPPHPPALPSSLDRLDISYCKFLKTVHSLANLTSLTELRLEGVSVCEIPGLGELKMLATLHLRQVENLENLQGLENLMQLTVLVVKECGIVGKLPDVSNLTKLKSLIITGCKRLTEIQGLAGLKESLTFLTIDACACLEKVDGLESLESLQVISLRRYEGSTRLLPSSMSHFCKLQKLRYGEFWGVPDDMSPQEIPDLPINIKAVAINCRSIIKLPNLSRLTHLETLNVSCCHGLTELRGLQNLESLQKLTVSHCYNVKELNLRGAKNLRELKALHCTQLIRIHGIEELELLQVLEVDTTLRNTFLKVKPAASRFTKRLTRSLGL
ncbi:Putative adenylate cyclase regulatory protein, partial [Linum perenne]